MSRKLIILFSFSAPAINLLQYFLEDRSQCVKIGSEVSQNFLINHGVPQGTVLGPLIVLLYVNDFSQKRKGDFKACTICRRYLYIISMLLCRRKYCKQNSSNEIILLETDSCFKENQLTLNADNIELFLTIRDELETNVILKGNVIKSAESSRCLGIHLDTKFLFEVHLKVVLGKMVAAFRSFYLGTFRIKVIFSNL